MEFCFRKVPEGNGSDVKNRGRDGGRSGPGLGPGQWGFCCLSFGLASPAKSLTCVDILTFWEILLEFYIRFTTCLRGNRIVM